MKHTPAFPRGDTRNGGDSGMDYEQYLTAQVAKGLLSSKRGSYSNAKELAAFIGDLTKEIIKDLNERNR